jgi:uncharacterized protein YcnI
MSSTAPAQPHRSIRTRRHHLARVAVGGAVIGAVTFFGSAAASAHVHVDPSSTEPGAFSILTFRVPTESATASTIKVEVTLPSDNPFPSVSARALPGWTIAVVDAKLPKPVVDDDGATLTEAPNTVTWTADNASAIGPGEFGEFALQVGPLPASGTVVLPAVQTYSDGSTVTWDEPETSGGTEPEHPAPSFDITPVASPVSPMKVSSSTDHTARVLGVVGIMVGVIGAGIGLAGAVAARRRTPR